MRRCKCVDCGNTLQSERSTVCQKCKALREIASGVKYCRRCAHVQPREQFSIDRRYLDGLQRMCKSCRKRYQREHKKKLVARGTAARRVKRFGVSSEQFAEIFGRQRGLCAICLLSPATHLDHDHKTGTVRGILCDPCNRGLGAFKDNVRAIRSASFYLETRSANA